jgi:type IX secretion system PorP/SprF family membrane protein
MGGQVTFSMGLQVGLTNFKSDYTSLLGTSNDPKLVNNVNETKLDFGTGIYLTSQRLSLGLSSLGLLSHTVNLNDTLAISLDKTNFLGSIRYRVPLNSNFEMEPGLLVKYYPDLPVSYDINLNLIYKEVMTRGLSYRSSESIDVILKFQITHQLQFGYAYDYPIKYASMLSNGSHELMIQYTFRNVHNNVESSR